MASGYRSDVYARAYGSKPAKRRTTNATTSSGGRTSKQPSSTSANRVVGAGGLTARERGRQKAHKGSQDFLKAQVLAKLQEAMGPQGGSGMPAMGPGAGGVPQNMPQVPVEPVAGNPYKGVDAAIGRFAQASASRSKGDVAAARAALKGRSDPGAQITGSFNTQAAGQAAENAMAATSLRNEARQGYAEEELKRRSTQATNRYEASSAQIKNDAELMGGSNQLSLSLMTQLASEGLDPMQYVNNPMMGAIALGRARFARRGESGMPPTYWAQAAQYGLQPPNTYGSPEDFQTALGLAKGGMYGGGDMTSFLQGLMSSGYLKPEDLQRGP